MSEWKKTSCVLCSQNCGLEVITEGSKIMKVRSDKENPRSQGYICRKGANVAYFQNNPERLRFPLKKVGDRFERISWNQALDEIAAKLKEIVQAHGPRCIAYMGEVVRVAILKLPLVCDYCKDWVRRITIALWPRNSPVFSG